MLRRFRYPDKPVRRSDLGLVCRNRFIISEDDVAAREFRAVGGLEFLHRIRELTGVDPRSYSGLSLLLTTLRMLDAGAESDGARR